MLIDIGNEPNTKGDTMKPKAKMKPATVAVRLTEAVHKRLLKTAKRHNERPSDTIRKAIALYLLEN